VLGPLSLCVGSFLPFQITYYLNGHHYIERELLRRKIEFRKNDNAFLAVAGGDSAGQHAVLYRVTRVPISCLAKTAILKTLDIAQL